MTEAVDALVLDLVEWIGPEGRPYAQVMEAWRTSCPRLPVWEEANARGLLEQRHDSRSGAMVSVSPEGWEALAEAGRKVSAPAGPSR